MTGKELIIYILQNNLEDEEVIKDGALLGCLPAIDAAVKLCVGEAAIQAWVDIGYLDGFKLYDKLYILPNYKYFSLLNMTLANSEHVERYVKQNIC